MVSRYFQQHKLVLSLALILLAIVLLISSCNLLDLGGEATPERPAQTQIVTPPDQTTVLLGGPVQIQSAHADPNTSRVELWVREPNAQADKLLRSDIPINGMVLQQWLPEQAGSHIIKVRSFTADNVQLVELTRTFQVAPNTAISLAGVATPPAQALGGPPTVIPLTPLPISPGEAAAAFTPEAGIQIVATVTPAPSPTPTPFYPPPPPAPGVPPGPIQWPILGVPPGVVPTAQLNVYPPVCDAAEYLGPYVGDTSRRIFLPGVRPEDDMLPIKVTAATLVHRAWRIRNTGTCTWGPGYELAFYGGRAMGSGGVAFESVFPAEPGRRNRDVDTNRLIVPEGKPNEIAVVEVLLTTPAIPGIHQSYWRMRNPQGVFFGPIVGVTMEVVRECQSPPGGPRIYGAPVINLFQPLGIGQVYQPTPIAVVPVTPLPLTPVPPVFLGRRNETIVVDFNVIQADNVDIIVEDPTGDVQRFAQTDPRGRFNYTPSTNRLGDYTFTLFADNGSCTVSQQFIVRIGPEEGEEFVIASLAFATTAPVDTTADAAATVSSQLAPNTVEVIWDYFNTDVNQFRLIAEQQIKTVDTSWQCTYLSICSEVWRPGQRTVSPVFDRNSADSRGREILTDISQRFCSGAAPGTVRIQYWMEAIKGAEIPGPTQSNTVTVDCLTTASIAPTPLPVEIPAP